MKCKVECARYGCNCEVYFVEGYHIEFKYIDYKDEVYDEMVGKCLVIYCSRSCAMLNVYNDILRYHTEYLIKQAIINIHTVKECVEQYINNKRKGNKENENQ